MTNAIKTSYIAKRAGISKQKNPASYGFLFYITHHDRDCRNIKSEEKPFHPFS